MEVTSGRVPLRVLDPWRLFHRYLLIGHLRTLGCIAPVILAGWVANSVLVHTAASAAVDAQVLQAGILVGLLVVCHGHLREIDALGRTVIAVPGSGLSHSQHAPPN